MSKRMTMWEAAKSEGYVAGEHGAGADHNPHHRNSELGQAWETGREEANDDYARDDQRLSRSIASESSGCLVIVFILFVALAIAAAYGFFN